MNTFRIILSLLAISCVVQAQEVQPVLERKVTHHFNEVSIEEALRILEAEHEGLVFVYSSSTFDMERSVSGDFREIPLKTVLEEIFKQEAVDFQEKKTKIIIKPRKKSAGKLKARVETKPTPSQGETARKLPKAKRKGLVRSPDTIALKNSEQERTTIQKVESRSVMLTQALEASQIIEERFVEAPVAQIDHHIALTFKERTIPTPLLNYSLVKVIDSTYFKSKSYQKVLTKAKRDSAKEARLQARLNEEKKFRTYLTSYTGYTQVGGEAGIQLGGSLVWLKNRRWGFGLSGYAVQSAVQNDMVLSSDYRLAGGYGGFFLEYTPRPSERFHFSFPLMVGGGGLTYMQQVDGGLNLGNGLIEDSQAFAVIEPGVVLETNLLRFLRVGMSLSYRYTTNAALNYQNNSDQIVSGTGINSFSFGVLVKVGVF